MDETARLKQDPHAEWVAKHPWYFQVTNDLAEVNVFLLDGSLIDEEYFSTLEPQTTLILQKPGEKVLSGSCCQLSLFLNDSLPKNCHLSNSVADIGPRL